MFMMLVLVYNRVRVKKQYMQGPEHKRSKEKRTYRAVGGLDRPADLQAESAKGQQKEVPTAHGLLCLLLALPVVIVQRRHGLLKQRVNLS